MGKAAKIPTKKEVKVRSSKKTKASIRKGAPAKEIRKVVKKAVKKREVKKSVNSKDSKLLEIGLLLDCTSSMSSWIGRAKDTLKQIVDGIVQDNDGKLKVRVCFVGYRDHCDSNRFSIMDFTDDIDKMKKYISEVRA
jgi:hypothetical protein